MKKIIFCYIGLLLGIAAGHIFLQFSGIIKDPTYSSPVARAIPGYVIWFAYLLYTGIPFTIFWAMLFIFSKISGWQIPVSKIQNIEIGFFFAFLSIAGELSAFGRFHSWVNTSWWKVLHTHLPFPGLLFSIFDVVVWVMYLLIIFVIIIVINSYILTKLPILKIPFVTAVVILGSFAVLIGETIYRGHTYVPSYCKDVLDKLDSEAPADQAYIVTQLGAAQGIFTSGASMEKKKRLVVILSKVMAEDLDPANREEAGWYVTWYAGSIIKLDKKTLAIVIPYWIKALDWKDEGSEHAISSLRTNIRTKRPAGLSREETIVWWKNWWEKNKDKHQLIVETNNVHLNRGRPMINRTVPIHI